MNENNFREVDVEGLEEYGHGTHCTVYKIEPDKVLKVFISDVKFEDIEQEYNYMVMAQSLNLRTPKAYEIVKVGDHFGIISELIEGITLYQYLSEHRDLSEEIARSFGELGHTIHTTHVPKGTLESAKELFSRRVDRSAKLYRESELRDLHEILDAIPDDDVLIHNDFHPNNMLTTDGTLTLIDLADMGYGNRLFDLGGTYMGLIYFPKHFIKSAGYVDTTKKDKKMFWNALIDAEYPGANRRVKKQINKRCEYMALLKMSLARMIDVDPDNRRAKYAVRLCRRKILPHKEEIIRLFSAKL